MLKKMKWNCDIPSNTNLPTKTTFHAKIKEVNGEIPSNTNLATKTTLNTVDTKLPSVNNLIKKSDYNKKDNEIEKKKLLIIIIIRLSSCEKSLQKFWKKKLGEYRDLYVQSDMLLLDDVFENFRNMCINIYELHPQNFFQLQD